VTRLHHSPSLRIKGPTANTSLRLEAPFAAALRDVARREGLTLWSAIDAAREARPELCMASATRCWLLEWYRVRASND
jgi:predicted DNA-binding ribbon-helix-helix protein